MYINAIECYAWSWLEDYTEEDEEQIEKLWRKCGNKYIVDSVSQDQALRIMLDEIPYVLKMAKIGKIKVIKNNNDLFNYYYNKKENT